MHERGINFHQLTRIDTDRCYPPAARELQFISRKQTQSFFTLIVSTSNEYTKNLPSLEWCLGLYIKKNKNWSRETVLHFSSPWPLSPYCSTLAFVFCCCSLIKQPPKDKDQRWKQTPLQKKRLPAATRPFSQATAKRARQHWRECFHNKWEAYDQSPELLSDQDKRKAIFPVCNSAMTPLPTNPPLTGGLC